MGYESKDPPVADAESESGIEVLLLTLLKSDRLSASPIVLLVSASLTVFVVSKHFLALRVQCAGLLLLLEHETYLVV